MNRKDIMISRADSDIILQAGISPKKDKQIIVSLKRDKLLYLMLLPVILFFLLFEYRPMYGLQIAFKEYSLFKGIAGSEWIGLQNFRTFFDGPYFMRLLRNTFLINIYNLFWSFPVPILLALLFNEMKNSRYKSALQTATYLPHFISVVVVTGIVTNLLSKSNGLINIIIDMLGGQKVYFLTRPENFRTIYITMGIWQSVGFASIIYISALSGVDQELYEAAVIDGANRFKQVLNISIPSILPTIIIMLILRLGNLLKVGYESIILLYQPSTYETADVISTYVYRSGIVDGDYAMATAVGLIDSVIALVLTMFANALSRRVTETSLW